VIQLINRRAFLGTIGGAFVVRPSAAETQQLRTVPRVGQVHGGLDHDPPALAPLGEALDGSVTRTGNNILFDYRNQRDEEAAWSTARAFVREGVDLLVALENQAIRAAQAATSEVPIVFAHEAIPSRRAS
jgi:hypothetical protein